MLSEDNKEIKNAKSLLNQHGFIISNLNIKPPDWYVAYGARFITEDQDKDIVSSVDLLIENGYEVLI